MVILGIVLWLLIGIGVAVQECVRSDSNSSPITVVVGVLLWPVLLGIVLLQMHYWLLNKEDKE